MRIETLRQRRRRRAVEAPFPDEWSLLLEREMAHWLWLDDGERVRLEHLIKGFLVDTRFEWVDGLEESDEIRVLVAASACLLILGIDHAHFKDVTSIIMHPRATELAGQRAVSGNTTAGTWHIATDAIVPIIGLAVQHGPVLIAWDSAKRSAADPTLGHNVIYHEFAHKIDMADGLSDGVPPMGGRERERWEETCRAEYEMLRDGIEPDSILGDYAAVSPSEFFAVATEIFFGRSIKMETHKEELYRVMQEFYGQDPAERERRFLDRASI